MKTLSLVTGRLGGPRIRNSPANAGDGSIPGWEDPLEKEMATPSNILDWEIPWTGSEEPGGYSPWGPKVSGST